MNTDWNDLIQRYLGGQTSDEETRRLEAALKADDALADLYLRHTELDVALEAHAASSEAMTELLIAPDAAISGRSARWLSWRPIAAAAAGIVFGMFCTSVVYGFVTQRPAPKRIALAVDDPGFEGGKPLDKGLPHGAEEWGVRAARVVTAENGVQPLHGLKMLCMEPVLMRDDDERLYSDASLSLDLRPLTAEASSGSMEVQVSASFAMPKGSAKQACQLKLVALNEPPDKATRDFWPKLENDGVVSLTQRFEIKPDHDGWRTFSVKMPLPANAQTLVVIFSAVSLRSSNSPPVVRYLDDVQANVLITPAALSSLP